MKQKNLILATLVWILIIGMSQSNFATTTQWFPTEGTTCEYNITYTYFLTNGTNFESNKFDLYSGGGFYYAIPSLNKYLFTEPAHSNSVANDTEIKYRHSYTESSSTQWTRSKTVIWGQTGNETPNVQLDLYYASNKSFSIYITLSGAGDTVDKNNFFTSMAYGAFLDYFDNTVGINGYIYKDFLVTALTSEIIIAYKSYGATNVTYIASRDGKVKAFIKATADSLLESGGIKSVSFVFTLIEAKSEPGTGVPSFSIILTISGLIIGVLLVEIAFKRKLLKF